MGQARGKVGSVVFSRSKGQQITRAYNEKPKNPRSNKQMSQRSVFMAATNFFSRGKQAFFQFAFEGKENKHSDYNAFVSANSQKGIRMSKAANEEPTYPSIAPWMMTKGTLGELPLELNADNTAFELTCAGLTAEAGIGLLSKSIIDTYGLNEGDIITICMIQAPGSDTSNTPSVAPDKRDVIRWEIKQFALDTASTEAIVNVLGSAIQPGAAVLTIAPANMSNAACGACVTASRTTNDGLKVSNTYLCLNSIAEDIYEAGQTEAYIGKVLKSWNATGEAILQGSLVQ